MTFHSEKTGLYEPQKAIYAKPWHGFAQGLSGAVAHGFGWGIEEHLLCRRSQAMIHRKRLFWTAPALLVMLGYRSALAVVPHTASIQALMACACSGVRTAMVSTRA